MEINNNEPILASAEDIRAALRLSRDMSDLYIEPAAAIDVMFEQLRYLDSHAQQKCAPKCADCVRLNRVKAWLLLPFSQSRSVKKQ